MSSRSGAVSYLNQVPDNWVFNIRKHSLSSISAAQPHPRHCQPSSPEVPFFWRRLFNLKTLHNELPNSTLLLVLQQPHYPRVRMCCSSGLSSSKVQLRQAHHPRHIYWQCSIIHRMSCLSQCQQAVKKGQKKTDYYVAERENSQDIQGNSGWPECSAKSPRAGLCSGCPEARQGSTDCRLSPSDTCQGVSWAHCSIPELPLPQHSGQAVSPLSTSSTTAPWKSFCNAL